MNAKTLTAILRLRNNLQCSCGAPYKVLSVVEIKDSFCLLHLLHGFDPTDINIYPTREIYDLETNKLFTDGAVLSSDVKRLWLMIKQGKIKNETELIQRRKLV